MRTKTYKDGARDWRWFDGLGYSVGMVSRTEGTKWMVHSRLTGRTGANKAPSLFKATWMVIGFLAGDVAPIVTMALVSVVAAIAVIGGVR